MNFASSIITDFLQIHKVMVSIQYFALYRAILHFRHFSHDGGHAKKNPFIIDINFREIACNWFERKTKFSKAKKIISRQIRQEAAIPRV